MVLKYRLSVHEKIEIHLEIARLDREGFYETAGWVSERPLL